MEQAAENISHSVPEAEMDCESGEWMDEEENNEDITASLAMLKHLPDWCKDHKYQRYWRHFDQLKQWFGGYSRQCEENRTQQACRKDPLFQQYAMTQAWNSSYWVYYHYYNMLRWQQRCQQLQQRGSQAAFSMSQRADADRHAMPPPSSTFVPSRWQAPKTSFLSQSSASSECQTNRKRPKPHVSPHQVDRKHRKEHVTDIVLDLDPSVLKQEEEVIECHMEITDEMLEFFAQSAKHRQERDAQKIEDDKEGEKDKYIDISRANTGVARATTEAPSERPGLRRTQEMKLLYGRGAAMIHGMETAMQLTFDRYADLNQPKLWPHLPISIKFN